MTEPQAPPHPARVAALNSQAAVRAKDKARWLELFDGDACIEDPVGPSWLDPDGRGHRGHDAINAFWDKAIAIADDIDFRFGDSFACGNEVAFTGTIRTRVGRMQVDSEGVFIYRVNDAGKLVSLRAMWEVDRAMNTAVRLPKTDLPTPTT